MRDTQTGRRGLSPQFLDDLKAPDGALRWLLDRAQTDRTVCLELRDEYINVYYRGGGLLKVDRTAAGSARFSFDTQYFQGADIELPQPTDTDGWRAIVPQLKDAIDRYTGKQSLEREFQQLVVWTNNMWRASAGANNNTDYFMCDLEYDNRANARFDMVGVHWPSNSQARQQRNDRKLALIEMKYGSKALTGSAGLAKHAEDILTFVSDAAQWSAFAEEMAVVFEQKVELGLIAFPNSVESFADRPEVLFLLAEYDPDTTALATAMEEAQPFVSQLVSMGVDVRFVRANYCGYGLYEGSGNLFIEWSDIRRQLERRESA